MARNQEVIRQWTILQAIEATRLGLTIPTLAKDCGVSTRTIRRDLVALQEVGFPIYDEERDGGKYWRLDPGALRGLGRDGFTVSEACALYFGRSMLETLAGSPFRRDVGRAFDKVAAALPPAMRQFLDRLPQVVAIKTEARLQSDQGGTDTVPRLLEASLHHRRIRMRYHSLSNNRTKDYLVEPGQVVYGRGALYLLAFVPEYSQVRTFAVSRIERLSVLEETFEPAPDATAEAFSHSLGIHQGEPTRVVLAFEPSVSAYVAARTWHPSQQVQSRPDGSLIVTLSVCNDWALRSWVLGFGSLVRVLEPAALAESVLDEVEGARRKYAPPIEFDIPRALFDRRAQRLLPFRRSGAGATPGTRRRATPRPSSHAE
jgi:proteasome accessory factor B